MEIDPRVVPAKKLKVVFSLPSVSRLYTGVYEVSRNLALELSKSDLDVDVDVHGLIDAYTESDLGSWIPVVPNVHRILGPQSIGYSRTYFDSLVASNASVGHIHALWSYTSYVLYRWSHKTHKSYLLSANGYLDPWALGNSRFKKNIAFQLGFRSVLSNAGCIQVNSSLELDSVRSLGLNNPMCLISNGVDLPDLDLQQDAPWPSSIQGRKVLLFLGRIDNKKGVKLLLQAWKSLVEKGETKEWHLVLVGFSNDDSKYEVSVKAFVATNRLKGHVTCLNGKYGKDMEACYRNCDAFILPSSSEGASIAVLNAWAFSKPVIATDECGFPDAAVSGCAVRIEATRNSVEYGILSCLEMSEDERSTMGHNGLQLVAQKYSWPVIAKEVFKVYQWIISKDAPPPDSLVS